LDPRTFRRLALAIAIAWFVYWGQLAYRSLEARQAAEQAAFLADRRQDWVASQAHSEDRKEASAELVRATKWGFLFPMSLLVFVEAGRAIRRRPTGRSV